MSGVCGVRKCSGNVSYKCVCSGQSAPQWGSGGSDNPRSHHCADPILIAAVPTPPRAPVVSCNHPPTQHVPLDIPETLRLHQLKNELLWLPPEPASPIAFSTWPLSPRGSGPSPWSILDSSVHTLLPGHEEIPLASLLKYFRDLTTSPLHCYCLGLVAIVCGPAHCSGSCLV